MKQHSILQKNPYSFNALPLWKQFILLSLIFLTIFTITISLSPVFASGTTISACVNYSEENEIIVYDTQGSCDYCDFMRMYNGDYKGSNIFAETAAKWYTQSIYPQQWKKTAEKYIVLNTNESDAWESADRIAIREDPFSYVWNTITIQYGDIFVTTGVLIMTMFLLFSLLDDATSDHITPEIFLKTFSKFLLGYLIMSNLFHTPTEILDGQGLLPAILNAFSTLGMQVTGNGISMVPITTVVFERAKEIANGPWTTGIGQIFSTMPAFVSSGILGLFVRANAYGRLIEISVISAYAPIGIAGMFGGRGAESIRFLKKIAALALQGAIMYLICLVTCNFIIASSNNIELIGNLAFMFAGASLVGKSRRIASDIVGV